MRIILSYVFTLICLLTVFLPLSSSGAEIAKGRAIKLTDTSGFVYNGEFKEVKADTLFFTGKKNQSLSLCRAGIASLYVIGYGERDSYGPHLRIIGGLTGFALGGMIMINKKRHHKRHSLMEVFLIAGLGLGVGDLIARSIPEKYIPVDVEAVFDTAGQSEISLHNMSPEMWNERGSSANDSRTVIGLRVIVDI